MVDLYHFSECSLFCCVALAQYGMGRMWSSAAHFVPNALAQFISHSPNASVVSEMVRNGTFY